MKNTFVYYDVESLNNVFTHCYWDPQKNKVYVYYLVDELPNETLPKKEDWYEQLVSRIKLRNPIFQGNVELHDLKNTLSFAKMACQIGCSIDEDIHKQKTPTFQNIEKTFEIVKSNGESSRLICDTNPDYSPSKHPYIAGYNSYNYDTTMLAYFFYESLSRDTHSRKTQMHSGSMMNGITAKEMREFNDQLFDPQFKKSMASRLQYKYNPKTQRFDNVGYKADPNKIRSNMLRSGRHIDVARLNESQAKVGLKRLLGLKGYQILESDKLSNHNATIQNLDELLELLAYNVSDVIYLEKLMHDKLYMSNFELKQALLQDYPELVYQQKKNAYEPDVSQNTVRFDRLMADSSSAQFASKILCPYGRLDDYEAVSFNYPHPDIAAELGIPVVNVLEEAKKFFYGLFQEEGPRKAFDEVYEFYKSIEGKNFNESVSYLETHGVNLEYKKGLEPWSLKDIPKRNGNIPYFDKNGKQTMGFTNMSTGGTHGQELNLFAYLANLMDYTKEETLFNKVKEKFPDPLALRHAKEVEIDGVVYLWKQFLKSGTTLKKAEYKDFRKKKPYLFKPTGIGTETKLADTYAYTSVGIVNHEDFKSFYPNMLRRMKAFHNDNLGYDRYGKIYDQKEEFGALMKEAKAKGDHEAAAIYDRKRNGTKLVMNAASGAGDTNYDNPIRVNNKIISMRIIGQIFAWRIGQAQAYKGARITSTNTDGLFTIMEETLNNQILDEQSKHINVDIEPEVIYLISKDSNNRVEFSSNDYNNSHVEASGGGTVGCYFGPDVRKSLNHPAIIDWALVEYMKYTTMVQGDMELTAPFQPGIGRQVLEKARQEFDNVKYLNMFQNIIASSIGSMDYIFGIDDNGVKDILQHYNRVFIMKDQTPNTKYLQSANVRVITDAVKAKRARLHETPVQHDPDAIYVLAKNGVGKTDIPIGKEAIIKKITRISPDWYMRICNQDLNTLTKEQQEEIIQNIDLEKYLQLLEETYENNWKNDLSYRERYTEEELMTLL